MEILALLVYIFLLIRFVVTLINFLSKPLLSVKTDTGYQDMVSILVPARNEAHTLPYLLASIRQQTYTSYELLILDDASTDETAQIVQQYIRENPETTLFSGKPLPHGWLGKNWACHQLARKAKGKYLLFIDADVRLEKNFIYSALYEVKTKQLALLSVFNDQLMQSSGEKIVVPLMHYILLCLLPLRMVFTARDHRVAAASGQCMLFDSEVYQQYQFHEVHKNQVAEDISIMRFVKKQQLKGSAILANHLIKCRMYGSFTESIQGFSKNLIAGFEGNVVLSIVIICLCTLGYLSFIPAYYSVGAVNKWAANLLLTAALVLIGSIRIMISRLSNQPVLTNLVLHPLQMISYFILLCTALYKHFTNSNQWKGRTIITK